MMSPRTRRLALTAHVTLSVGWLGAVTAFLGLAALGLSSQNPRVVRGAYLLMEPTAWLVLVPLAFASLLSGVIQGLGSPWGLFRHYWVVFKLLINVVATAVLVAYTQTFSVMADAASDESTSLAAVRSASPLVHAVAAIVLLLAATALAIYKPRGVTPFGRRRRHG